MACFQIRWRMLLWNHYLRSQILIVMYWNILDQYLTSATCLNSSKKLWLHDYQITCMKIISPNLCNLLINQDTALLCVQNNILKAIDDHKAVVLVLLDLSAAFDIIDHNILPDRLQKRLGVNGAVPKWFESYVRDRKQCIFINGIQSPPVEVKYGVPQGSVLGPKLFI